MGNERDSRASEVKVQLPETEEDLQALSMAVNSNEKIFLIVEIGKFVRNYFHTVSRHFILII